MLFAEINGLEEVKTRLIQSVKKGHLPHALLFSGEKGSLNLPLALAFSTFLNCENRQEDDACGECNSCSKNKKFIHPDLHFVFPVTTQAGIKPKDVISQTFLTHWREFLTEKPWAAEDTWSRYLGSEDKQFNISKEESRQIISSLSLKPFEGEYKIMLIWLPEYMHPSAANGILKILEEPADKTVFLLVTNDRERLLSTILSRVLTIPVRKMSQEELVENLVKNYEFAEEKAVKTARTAEGNLEQALNLSNNEDDEVMSEFRNWLLLCYGFKRRDLVDFTEKFNGFNKLGQRSFLKYGSSVLRELIIYKTGAGAVSKSSTGELEFIGKLSQLLNVRQIESLFQWMDETLYLLERNVNARTAFLDLSLRIAQLFRSK